MPNENETEATRSDALSAAETATTSVPPLKSSVPISSASGRS